MAPDQDDTALRVELADVEEELSEARRTAADVRAEIGSRNDGAVDPEEMAQLITSAEGQEALARSLQARRDRIRARLTAIEA